MDLDFSSVPFAFTESGCESLIFSISYLTAGVMLLLSPLFLLPVVCIPKLRTLCRKTVFMIILSDLTNCLSLATKHLLMTHHFSRAAVVLSDWLVYASYLWSLSWLVKNYHYLINVYLTNFASLPQVKENLL